MAVQAQIERETKVNGKTRLSGADFLLYDDRLVVDMGGGNRVAFQLTALKTEAAEALGLSKPARVAPKEAKAVASAEARDLKVKINKDFNSKMRVQQLTKNWRNRPMTMLGIAIILAEAKGDKETNGRSGTRNIINAFNTKAVSSGAPKIESCGKNGQSPIYSLSDVERLKDFYLENWKQLKLKLSSTAQERMAKKPVQA